MNQPGPKPTYTIGTAALGQRLEGCMDRWQDYGFSNMTFDHATPISQAHLLGNGDMAGQSQQVARTGY